MEKQTYNFIDELSIARTSNRTLKEQILIAETMIEDPRVSKVFGDEFTVMESERRSQELLAKKMQKIFGDEMPVDFGDNAPIGAYATNALERLDMNVRKQALRTYATRDIPFQYGGGALESIKGFKEMYQLPKGGFIGGDTNEVRIVKVDFKPQFVPVKPLTYGLRLGYIDSMKNAVVGFDAITKYGEAIQKAWALDIDRIGYVGSRGEDGTTSESALAYGGLLNLTDVDEVDLEVDYASYGITTERKLEKLGIQAVIAIFTKLLNDRAKLVDWTADLVPNKILFYKELFAWLNTTADNAGGTATPFRTNRMILQEALDMWCDSQGFDKLKLEMLPYLSSDISTTKDASMVKAGTNSTGLIVIYRQDPYSLYLPLPLDLTGGAIVYDVNTNAYRKNYLSFVGYLMNFYEDNMVYLSNGSNNVYTITYDLDEGVNHVDNPATFLVTDLTITLGVATKDLNTFGGWYTEDEFTNAVTEISVVGNVSLFAKFTVT